MKTKTPRPFGILDKIGYALGDCGNDFSFILASMFLMKFYTDVMGISAALVGLMMMLAKFVDAITDVLMGQVCDRSKVKSKGKFTPWIRIMAGPVALASVLMYAVWFKNMSLSFKIFWMFFSYLLWGSICYTGINIPYGSMASAISDSAKDRTSLSTCRSIGATIAGMLLGVVSPMIVYYKDQAGHMAFSGERMFYLSVVCSILALLCYAVCYLLTTERVKMETISQKFVLKDFMKTVLGSRSLIGIIVCALLLLLGQLTLTGMNSYVFPNYFGNKSAMSLISILTSALMIIFSFFISSLSSKFGKKEVAFTGCVISVIALVAGYFIHTSNVYVFFVIYLLAYVGLALFNLLCWAMITDVIDDVEVKSGTRNDGSIYAVYSFARKLGQALSSGLIGALLSIIGYTQETAFDAVVTAKIYNLTCLAPAVAFFLLALSLQFLYPLNKGRVEKNISILREKRNSNQ